MEYATPMDTSSLCNGVFTDYLIFSIIVEHLYRENEITFSARVHIYGMIMTKRKKK